MSIRRKLTFLLLFMTLVPLVISRIVYARISWNTSNQLANQIRNVLEGDAENHLLTVTEDFSRLLDAEEKVIELIARLQAQKVEKRLVDAMLAKDGHLVINRPIKSTSSTEETATLPEKTPASSFPDWDRPIREIPLADSSNLATVENFGLDEKIDVSSGQIPLRYPCADPFSNKSDSFFEVSYQKQGCHTIGTGGPDRRFELHLLGSMTSSYWLIRQIAGKAILWQYTILESGIMTSYPFSTERTIQELGDPRTFDFYLRMKDEQKIFFSPPTIDRATGLAVFTIAVPLFYPDGSFAGMTGMDLIANDLFRELRLPPNWQKNTTSMLVKRLGPYSKRPGEIAVLAKKTPENGSPKEIQEDLFEEGGTGERPVFLPSLKASDPTLLNQIVDQAEAGKSGIVRMEFDGKESLWAFGPAHAGKVANEPFLIVIVPKENIVAQADENRSYILDAAFHELQITGAFFLGVAIIAAAIGFRSAKKITRPIGQIAEAGIRLSNGDYHAHVEIHTKDELQRLGEVFNETGPKLLEREKMMHSLSMAMEVQQQLLPQAPPEIEGLDLAGGSFYCDETGGDYFDYLVLRKKDGDMKRVGVAIGDVSGHGIGSALIMASVRSVLRSHAGQFQDRLGELMNLLNRSLTDGTETGRFVTFCFSLFDPKQRTLRWVSAGHDPALHVHRDQDTGRMMIDELPNSGFPLGIVEDIDYEEKGPIDLGLGDIVLFGTDGIWETSDSAGNSFGKERLRQLLLTLHDQTANTIREAILEAVTTFRGDGPQVDDITLVVVKIV